MNDMNSSILKNMLADLNQQAVTSITLIWDYVQLLTDDHTINIHPPIPLKLQAKHYNQNQITIAMMQDKIIGQTISDIRTDGKNVVLVIGSSELIFEIGKSISRETLDYRNRRNPQISYSI